MSGWVYVFVNAAVPNHVKVGFTERDPATRAKELAVTGLPGEYTVAYCIEVENPRQVEQATHRLLGEERYHKEWFQCSIERATEAVQQAASGQATEQGEKLDEEDDDESPLIGGHPLGRPAKSNEATDRTEFSTAKAAPGRYRPQVLLSGNVEYNCPHCEHATFVPDTPTARCDYCGKTGFLR